MGPQVYAAGPYAHDTCAAPTSAPIRLDDGAILSFHRKLKQVSLLHGD